MAICLWPTGVNGLEKYLGRNSVAFVQIFFYDYIVEILAPPTLSSHANNIFYDNCRNSRALIG